MRITPSNHTDPRSTLAVEGWIAREDCQLLEAECNTLLKAGRTVALDLFYVSYVDGRGVSTLRRLIRRRVEIVRCPPFILELVNNKSGA